MLEKTKERKNAHEEGTPRVGLGRLSRWGVLFLSAERVNRVKWGLKDRQGGEE